MSADAAKQNMQLQATLREGYARLTRGDVNGAGECCRRILQQRPDLVEGHFLVGLVASQSEDLRTAVQAFGSVTKLQPDHGAAWSQLARLFIRLGQLNRGQDALTRAVEHADDNPVVQDTIATVYTLLGDAHSAAEWQGRALAAQPTNPGFLINRANNQMFLGDFVSARNNLMAALDVNPRNANAHWLLSGLAKARDREHTETLTALLETPGLNDRDEAFLAYGLGKELEDLEDWSHAFAAFSQGAAARRRTMQYDEANEAQLYTNLAEQFTGDWLHSKSIGSDSTAPIFVVGQPRTGTTLIERIITSHSQVHSAGELRQFEGACRRLLGQQGDGSYASLFAGAAGLDPQKLGDAYLTMSKPLRGSLPRFVDKLPVNFRFIPLILAALPRAKIVHVRRSPMDACFASFKQLFADAYSHSYEQAEMARHHARYYHLMEKWRKEFAGRFYEIDYEAVATAPAVNARGLIDYLELPWEDQCLAFERQSGAVTTASVVQVREAAHTRSIGRWRRYETELQVMRSALEEHQVPTEHQF